MIVVNNKVMLDPAEAEVLEIAFGAIPSLDVEGFKAWASKQVRNMDGTEHSGKDIIANLSARILVGFFPDIHLPLWADDIQPTAPVTRH